MNDVTPPVKKDRPDLTRTAQAVRAYDKANSNLMAAGRMDNKDAQTLMDECEEALLKVKEAFALDTADRNSKDQAMLVDPDNNNGWLRHQLYKAGFTDCAPPPETRKLRGWGW